MNRIFLPLLIVLAAMVSPGCGPSANELRERTISQLNAEADRWDGGKNFLTTAKDIYGNPLTSSVTKTTLNYVLEIRSNGPDGLVKNNDDIVVTRTKPHGGTTITEQAEKAAEAVSRGVGSGVIQGVKKGLGFGAERKKKE